MDRVQEIEQRPLSGIKVVETSSYLTGPYAGLQLADLGADVIKVEPPGGDPFRHFGVQNNKLSATWVSSNRGKRSIFLNLKDPADLEVALAEIATADVLISNWRPHVAAKLGLSREAIRALNPRIINLAISGFGDTGEMAGKPTYDSLIQARTGMCQYGMPEAEPSLSPIWIVDKVVGTQAAQAILAALYQRERTNEGCDVDLAMLDATSYFNVPDMLQARIFEGDSRPIKRTPTTMFETSDGHILICPVNGKQMSNTLDAIGKSLLKQELTSISHPVERTEAFNREVATVVKTRTSEEWLNLFDLHDVPAGPVWTIDEHLNDPAVEHNEIYSFIGNEGDKMRAARYPAIFNGQKLAPEYTPLRIEPIVTKEGSKK